MYRKLPAVAFIAVAVLMALPVRAEDTTLYALVAANATQPFDAIDDAFEKSHRGVTVKANFTGTQILEQQLENGAPCDVFLSADLPHIQKIKAEHLVDDYRLISSTHEVIVVPKSNPGHVRSLRDLANKGVKLVVGVPAVPIGIYTRAIFAKAERSYRGDFSKNALANVVSLEVNVKAVLQKVVLDEADAGIVYETDVDAEAREKVDVIEIPKDLNISAKNYIAVANGSKNAGLARELVRYALSPAGHAIFERSGYDRKTF